MNKRRKIIHHLSEDTIKEAAISCLQSHYGFRPSLMGDDLQKSVLRNSELDVKLDDDIIIDGYISYKQRNGEEFTAALEASSHAKKEEVLYKIQKTLLRWDSFAIFLPLCSLLFAFFYFRNDYYLISTIGIIFLLCYVLISLFLSSLYQWGCMNLFEAIDRYHYIYAVEQFKRYHADEQWIAIGEDVFLEEGAAEDEYIEGSLSPEFVELKDQCVKNGFGLIEIKEDLRPIILATPSREVVLKNRKRFSINDFAKKRVKNIIEKAPFKQQMKSGYKKTKSKVAERLPINIKNIRQSTNRFQRTYYVQMGICVMSLVVVAALYWNSSLEKPYETTPDIDAYRAALDERTYGQQLKELEVEDSLDQLHIQAFQDVNYDYLETPADQPSYELKKKKKSTNRYVDVDDFEPIVARVDTPTLPERPVDTLVISPQTAFYFTSQGIVIDSFTCNAILEYNQEKYLVQESIHPTKKRAFQQMVNLAQKGINANIFHTYCIDSVRDSFVLFLDPPFDSLNVAIIQARLSVQQLQLNGFPSTGVKIKVVELDSSAVR
ncbi:MAG: hypothetical protein AAF849_18445 [Bacteroidota bacterium]